MFIPSIGSGFQPPFLALAPILTIGAMSIAARFFPDLLHPEHIPPLGLVGAILVVIGSMSIALGKKVLNS
jgi:hypothetical protein